METLQLPQLTEIPLEAIFLGHLTGGAFVFRGQDAAAQQQGAGQKKYQPSHEPPPSSLPPGPRDSDLTFAGAAPGFRNLSSSISMA